MERVGKRIEVRAPLRAVESPAPWWIEAADLECAHCGSGYAFEREVRCIDCDSSMCPMCMIRIGARVLCPDCGTEGRH